MSRMKTSKGDAPKFKPGDFVREFARRMGWGEFSLCNLMLEGTTDADLFRIANDLYRAKTGNSLIDNEFGIFAVGERGDGGTNGIRERLRTLSANLRADPIDENGRPIRVICLMDDDPAGLGAFRDLKKSFTPWQDIFRIQRQFPRVTRDPSTFGKMWKKQNTQWADLNCETEDLINKELLDYFASENPTALKKREETESGICHFDFDGLAKPKLVRFVRKNASLEDMRLLVEQLQGFRWLLRLTDK